MKQTLIGLKSNFHSIVFNLGNVSVSGWSNALRDYFLGALEFV